MRIAIFGAGAVGGNLAARFSLAGADVVVFARGPHADAIGERGLIVRDESGERHAKDVRLVRSAADAGPVDAVILTTKAHHQGDAVRAIAPLIDAGQPVVFVANGIPWWYGTGMGLPGVMANSDPARLALDPDGDIGRIVPIDRVIGCVLYSPNRIVEPGVVQNMASANRFMLGTPDAAHSARVEPIAELFRAAKIPVETHEPIRLATWRKLQFSLCMAPVSALAGLTNGQMYENPDMIGMLKNMEREGLAVAAAHGFQLEPYKGLPGDGIAPGHKNSMRQDIERGARVEFEPAVGLPRAYAKAAGLSCPTLDTVATLLKAKLAGAGLL